MEELESEPVDDSRDCDHILNYFPILQSSHLI